MSETRRAEEQLQEIERLMAQLHASRDDLERFSRSSSGHIARLRERWHDPRSGAEIERLAGEVAHQAEMARQEVEKLSATLWQTLAQAREALARRQRDEREREAGSEVGPRGGDGPDRQDGGNGSSRWGD